VRITSLDIVGFRAFGTRQHLDLDADTIIVVGANGQGKTSLFDSVLWGLAGSVPRLHSEESVLSLFSDAGECRVAVGLRGQPDLVCEAVRSFDGKRSRLSFTANGATGQGPSATTALLEQLWPDALAASDPGEALVSAMETGVYLQQDLVRAFIDAATDVDRFNTIGELVGVGRVTELQTQLESSRNAWTRVTNRRASEAEELTQRRTQLQDQLDRLRRGQAATSFDASAWHEWWASARGMGISVQDVPDAESAGAGGELDASAKELQAIEQAEGRRRQAASALEAALADLPSPPEEDLAALQAEENRGRAELDAARTALEGAEQQAAEFRRLQVQAAEAQAELRALAELALRHLGEHCPVCDQEYDRDGTRKRLEARLANSEPEATAAPLPDVVSFAAAVREKEKALAGATRSLSEAQQHHNEWRERSEELEARAAQLGLIPVQRTEWASELGRRLAEHAARLKDLRSLRERADVLALALARVGEHARQSEVERELAELEHEMAAATADLRRRRATGDIMSQVIEGLRAASADLIEQRLEQMARLLQRIYSTADPHPAFRVARLVSSMQRGRGRVVPEIEDPVHGASSETPDTVLSSSQMNVLAVSVFLTLNLGMATLPLEALILDDPLQSLDDMNLLGLVDLLRRTRERRQVLISTHDSRLAALLERKLRPVRTDQRTIVIDLEGWSREGPTMRQRDVDRDISPVRIAA
jgi:DNA repair exonuclease SbcCD ATPase subunit